MLCLNLFIVQVSNVTQEHLSNTHYSFIDIKMLIVFQVVFVLSSVFGAFMSSIFSGTYGSVPGVSITQSFVGGALIIFGARLAGGCTRYIFYDCCYNNILLIRY